MTAFVAVAEEQGFAPAARRLGMSTSSVSRHIADLEAYLATPLLHRTTRRLSLTESGERYLPRALAILEEMSCLNNEVGDLAAAPKGRLRITSSPTFGDHFLAPIATGFAKAYPQISVSMDFTERVVDIVAEGYDAAVRAGLLNDSSLKSRKLADHRFVLCASPEYLRDVGPLNRPEDLAHVDCIHWRLRAAKMVWSFLDGERRIDVPVSGRFLANSSLAELEAARASLGVAMLSPVTAAAYFASGQLVQVLPDFEPEPSPINIVWPAARTMPHKLRVFIDFVAKELHNNAAAIACDEDTP
ncbi:MAG: LysR family transcriptional regulator [Rhodobacteraceae bacterium]|nr:LysR family transcriptional regulator [Paracoccaceae bacterium]